MPTRPNTKKQFHVFGQRVVFDSNQEKVLEAAIFAEQMYSAWDPFNDSTWRVHLTVHDLDHVPAPPPERLIAQDPLHGRG